MADIVIDAKCPKLPQRPYFHYIRENVSHRSYEATCCIKFAVLETHWVKVNSIVLAFRYPSSLRNKTKKSKECPKLPLFTLIFVGTIDPRKNFYAKKFSLKIFIHENFQIYGTWYLHFIIFYFNHFMHSTGHTIAKG